MEDIRAAVVESITGAQSTGQHLAHHVQSEFVVE